MSEEIFINNDNAAAYSFNTTWKPVIYGIYLSDSWFTLEDGTIFYTFYREIAAATLHNLHKRHRDVTSRIATIGGDGQPEFLE